MLSLSGSGNKVRYVITDKVFSGVSWNKDLIWEILDGISNVSIMCIRHVAVDTSIVFNSQANVPCISTSRIPGETIFGVFMDQNFSTWGCNGCFVEIECTMKSSVCRKLGVEFRVSSACGNKQSHSLARKFGISNVQCGDKRIFEGLDHSFCCILTMKMRGDELVRNLVLVEGLFEHIGCFIVEAFVL